MMIKRPELLIRKLKWKFIILYGDIELVKTVDTGNVSCYTNISDRVAETREDCDQKRLLREPFLLLKEFLWIFRLKEKECCFNFANYQRNHYPIRMMVFYISKGHKFINSMILNQNESRRFCLYGYGR